MIEFPQELTEEELALRLKEWLLCGNYTYAGLRGQFPTIYLRPSTVDYMVKEATRIEIYDYEHSYWRERAVYVRDYPLWVLL